MRMMAKKTLSLVLVLALLMGLNCVPVNAAQVQEGDNGKVIYLSTRATKQMNGDEAQSVSANDIFVLEVNFTNNPTELKDSIWAFNLYLQYDETKMAVVNTTDGLASNAAVNKAYNSNIVGIT